MMQQDNAREVELFGDGGTGVPAGIDVVSILHHQKEKSRCVYHMFEMRVGDHSMTVILEDVMQRNLGQTIS